MKMECIVCEKESRYNKYKNQCICKTCIDEAQQLRDYLNSTRKFKFEERPVTTAEVIIKAIMKKHEDKEDTTKKDETES